MNCAKLIEGSLLWTVGQLFIIQRVGTVPLAPSLTGDDWVIASLTYYCAVAVRCHGAF